MTTAVKRRLFFHLLTVFYILDCCSLPLPTAFRLSLYVFLPLPDRNLPEMHSIIIHQNLCKHKLNTFLEIFLSKLCLPQTPLQGLAVRVHLVCTDLNRRALCNWPPSHLLPHKHKYYRLCICQPHKACIFSGARQRQRKEAKFAFIGRPQSAGDMAPSIKWVLLCLLKYHSSQ